MSTSKYKALKFEQHERLSVEDSLSLEQPLSIAINGKPFTLTMQTPGNEVALTRGLLFTEGVVKNRKLAAEYNILEKSEFGFPSAINVVLNESEVETSLLNKRSLLSVASCGICGKTELNSLDAPSLDTVLKLTPEAVRGMFGEMEKRQTGFNTSGGCHAAALFSNHKECLHVFEDIGRHNAVDKCIGQALLDGNLEQCTYMLCSGRISYEIVTKCFAAGVPFLLAVSAPSSLAVDFAKELGICLIGFCRESRFTVYSHHERLVN
jgi:FdhD protein